jgi:hypothetical protein
MLGLANTLWPTHCSPAIDQTPRKRFSKAGIAAKGTLVCSPQDVELRHLRHSHRTRQAWHGASASPPGLPLGQSKVLCSSIRSLPVSVVLTFPQLAPPPATAKPPTLLPLATPQRTQGPGYVAHSGSLREISGMDSCVGLTKAETMKGLANIRRRRTHELFPPSCNSTPLLFMSTFPVSFEGEEKTG